MVERDQYQQHNNDPEREYTSRHQKQKALERNRKSKDLRSGLKVNTSNISLIEEIFSRTHSELLSERVIHVEEEAKGPNEEDLFVIYKGRQLHILNQFVVMIAREVKRYHGRIRIAHRLGRQKAKLVFSSSIIEQYFPNMNVDSVPYKLTETVAQLINRRLTEYPNLKLEEEDLKVKIVDVLQLSYDVWQDWVSNQEFLPKRGAYSKKDANLHLYLERDVKLSSTIWRDELSYRKGEIHEEVEDTLFNWHFLLKGAFCWQHEVDDQLDEQYLDPNNPDLLSLLLNLNNEVVFEGLVPITYLIDLSKRNLNKDVQMCAFLTGQPDIRIKAVTPDGVKTVILDVKSSLREANQLETLVTKLQGYAGFRTVPGKFTPYEISNSWLREHGEEIGEVLVFHINPTLLMNDSFSFMVQNHFNIWEVLNWFQEVIEDACEYKNEKYSYILNNSANQRKERLKHVLREETIPHQRDVLSTLPDLLDAFFAVQKEAEAAFLQTGDEGVLKSQLQLEGFEHTAIKLFTKKHRERLEKERQKLQRKLQKKQRKKQ